MNDQVSFLLSRSAADFQQVVWPVARDFPIVGGGYLRPVEAVSVGDFREDLDRLAGIDAWQIVRETPMVRALASRVQWGSRHDTFSIRYRVPSGQRTEFEKRLISIRNRDQGHQYPHLTIHAYLQAEGGPLLSCAAIRTDALFEAAERLVTSRAIEYNRNPGLYGRQSLPDGTEFLYLSWNYLAFHGLLNAADVFPPTAPVPPAPALEPAA